MTPRSLPFLYLSVATFDPDESAELSPIENFGGLALRSLLL